jgi:uncharacterized membrane protein YhaH (DUF805 family)
MALRPSLPLRGAGLNIGRRHNAPMMIRENNMNWYFAALKKYAVFVGRARRREYWMFILTSIVISVVLGLLEGAISPNVSVFGTIYRLAILIPTVAVGVRRMHDTDHSGWWFMLPIANLILAVREGDRSANQYGPDPQADGLAA